MPWTEIANAPFLSAAGSPRVVRLSVLTPDAAELGVEDASGAPAVHVVGSEPFTHRVGAPDAHVLAEHAPTVVECSLLGLAAGALAGRPDADIRLDVADTVDGRLLYRGNVRAEDVRPGFGLGLQPLRLFAYDGVERLASVPYTAGADGMPAGDLTIAETAAALLAPLGDGLPVVTLLGWEHGDGPGPAQQRTDIARARSIRGDVGRWGLASGGSASDAPTYRDALKSFLVAFDLQLVQHATPATAPGGGGAVWLVVQRSVRTEALRTAAVGGGGTSPLTAAWVTGMPGAWTVVDAPVSVLGLASVTAAGVSVGPSVPRPWTPAERVVSQHPAAQTGLVDEDMVETVPSATPGIEGPRWWTGVKLATGVPTPAEMGQYPGEGEVGIFLGFGIGRADAVYQKTVRWYAAGTALDVQIRKRTGALAATGAKTSLRFGVVVAKTSGFPDLYLQPAAAGAAGTGPGSVARTWGTTYAFLAADIDTPTASTTGPVECQVVTAALPRAAQILVYVMGHQGRENSTFALSASVDSARGTAEVLGVEAAWPSQSTSSGQTRGRGVLADTVAVGDATATTRGTAALSVQAAGGTWAQAVSLWRARPGVAAAQALPAARVVDVAEQIAPALAGVDLLVPRVCLSSPPSGGEGVGSGLSALPWAGWLDWSGVRRLPVCVETDLVTGTVRAVAYPLASGSIAASAVSVYQYGAPGRVGPVEPVPVPPPLEE